MWQWLLLTVVIFSAQADASTEINKVIPRTILAFYDSELYANVSETEAHKSAEMPLNQLGLVMHYQDIYQALPDKKAMQDVRGILLWFYWDSMPEPDKFLRWMIEQLQDGKRIVIMGLHAFEHARTEGLPTAEPDLINQFWKEFGMQGSSEWVTVNYDVKLRATDPEMIGFERPLSGILAPFPIKKIGSKEMVSYLQAYRTGSKEALADLVATGPKGGYVSPDYSLIYSRDGKLLYWHIDPFRFFREAFATDEVPKADTTTLSGRRIYYSHVDGDGWRSISLVPGYREKKKTVTEVLLREVFEQYPDLPVTVAPVGAELDSNWFGSKENQRLAKEIFALPHVEAGAHTFSHPLNWRFFEHYSAEKEKPYLPFYPKVTERHQLQAGLKNLFGYGKKTNVDLSDLSNDLIEQARLKLNADKQVEVPRAFYTGEFSSEGEVRNSIDAITQYLPEGKRVELFQWSGDTNPFPEFIKQTRAAGIRNMNGGDTRLDREFDSYTWVAPVGLELNQQRQIYSSSSNENTYTDMWTSRFYGYEYLEKTLRRTETPWRIKPINIYYHNYSGERTASLNALHKNFAYARSQQIAPITASRYAAIGDGFFTATFERIGERQWRIKNRDQLQTIRFDNATFDAVDFTRSQYVIGQAHLHGSLYVFLDPVASAPVIALRKIKASDQPPAAGLPYLISGRWWVSNVERVGGGFNCLVQGFGDGDMQWYMPVQGQYRIIVEWPNGRIQQSQTSVADDHLLQVNLQEAPIKPLKIKIEMVQEHNAST